MNILTDMRSGRVVLLVLYDKEKASSVKVNVIKQMVRDMGLEAEWPLAPF